MPSSTDSPSPKASHLALRPIDYTDLPESLRSGMKLWLEQGIKPGSFLSAVIANNLSETFKRADAENTQRLRQIVRWFYNVMPITAWGSPGQARAWAKRFNKEFEWL